MNFTSTIFVLAVLWLMVANVESLVEKDYNVVTNNLKMDYEYKPNDVTEEKADVENFVDWTTVYYLIREAVSKMKGVKCTVQEVEDIKTATETFLGDVKKCGNKESIKLKELIEISEEIVSTSKDIIDVNENICNKAGNDSSADNLTKLLDIKTPFLCFFKLLFKTTTLQEQINYAIFLTDAVSNTPDETNECTVNAAKKLGDVLNLFPEYLKYCSQLLP